VEDKKRILFIIDSLAAGGAEKVVLTLARTMVQSGHYVAIISADNKIEYNIDFAADIHTLDFKKSKFEPTYFKYAKRLQRLVNKLEAEHGGFHLITVHLQKAHRLTVKAGIKNAYFCIHSTVSQGSLAGRTGLRLHLKRRRLKKLLDGKNIITVSNGIAQDLLEVVHIRPKSIQTIYNPVDFEHIRRLANETNPYKNEHYIIHVGRLTPSKRHDILLQAYAKSDITQKLLLLGDGPLKDSIQQLAHELGIAEKVIFAGFHPNPYPIIKGAKLSVLTSDYEGLPTVLIESLALQVPVLSTDCPSGPKEILTDQLANALSPVRDIDAMAQNIKNQFTNKKNSTAIKDSWLNTFTPQNAMSQYLSLAH
jgi:glycosyltransferase involved in cell wall biosynthesis